MKPTLMFHSFLFLFFLFGAEVVSAQAPIHDWNGTSIRFTNPDGSWGEFVNLQGRKGEEGRQGEKGNKGDKGEKGEKGERGEIPAHQWRRSSLRFLQTDGNWSDWVELQGPVGSKGDKGERGLKGEKGDKGDKGDPGENGKAPAHQWQGTALRFAYPDGSWGELVDLRGTKGEKGDRGEKGEAGIIGERGVAGDKGDRGEKGEKGDPGEKGTRGVHGERGLMGDKGDKGDKGDPGENGKAPAHQWQGSAIRFAFPDGSWGEYVDLRGAKGEKGDRGEKGEAGIIGERGVTGDKGERGEKGEKGEAGMRGQRGDKGERGDIGAAPAYQWHGTALRFATADGSWGAWVDLRGKPADQGQLDALESKMASIQKNIDKLEGFKGELVKLRQLFEDTKELQSQMQTKIRQTEVVTAAMQEEFRDQKRVFFKQASQIQEMDRAIAKNRSWAESHRHQIFQNRMQIKQHSQEWVKNHEKWQTLRKTIETTQLRVKEQLATGSIQYRMVTVKKAEVVDEDVFQAGIIFGQQIQDLYGLDGGVAGQILIVFNGGEKELLVHHLSDKGEQKFFLPQIDKSRIKHSEGSFFKIFPGYSLKLFFDGQYWRPLLSRP